MESLYLLEILLENFKFTDSKIRPKNEHIKARVGCGDLIKIVIEASNNGKSKITEFSLGKSVLFPTTAENLLSMMEKENLVIAIVNNELVETVGSVSIKWNADFIKAVKEYNNSGKMKPVLHNKRYDIINASKKAIGNMDIFLRLNTFGQNIEIDFQSVGSNVDVEKIKSRLKGTTRETERQLPQESSDEVSSWKPLFQSPFRENKSYMEPGMKIYAAMQGISSPPTVAEKLTTEYINSQLCGKRNCPGAQKFKKYGIGPLAPKGGGLGTLGTSLNKTNASGLYVRSQAYGNLNNYGAYGLFVKNRDKPTCGSSDCPYTNNSQYSKSGKNMQYRNEHRVNETNSTNCGGASCPYSVPQNYRNNTNYIHCGGQTCPYSEPDLKYSSNKTYLKNDRDTTAPCYQPQNYRNEINYNNSGGQPHPYSAPQMSHSLKQMNINCGGTTCPYSVPEHTTNVNNCGGQTCPYSDVPQKKNNSSQINNINCGGTTCPITISEKYEYTNIINDFCGEQACPYSTLQNAENINCGSTTCTYTITQNQIVTNEVINDNSDSEKIIYSDNKEDINDLNEMKMNINKNMYDAKPYSPQTFEQKVWEKRSEMGNAGSTKTRNTNKNCSRFVYRGERYPGTRIGHRTCNIPGRNVPSHMGWLWTTEPEGVAKRRKNWRPGSVSKVINERIIARREELGIPEPPALTMLVARKRIKYIRPQISRENFYDDIQPKPTLLIQKKDGRYLITMNPLKDPKTLAENENPYMECSPMQFIFVKKKPEPKPAVTDNSEVGEGEEEYEEYEEYEYEEEFEASNEGTVATVENEYTECYCDEDLKLLKESCSSTSSSDSELNIEFTTPAGIILPGAMKKIPNVVHTETQFHADDWNCADCPVVIPKKFKQKKRVRLRFR